MNGWRWRREDEAGKEEKNSIKEMWCVNLMRLTEDGVGKIVIDFHFIDV